MGRARPDLQWRPDAAPPQRRPWQDREHGRPVVDFQLRGGSPLSTTYERLKKLVVEQLGVEEDEVKPEASFVDDLNADSLDLVELIMSLEEEFGTEISDEDAEKIRTVQDAVDYIDEHNT